MLMSAYTLFDPLLTKRTHRDRPMYQIQVNVVQAQPLQPLVEAFFRSPMIRVPDFASYEDIFSLDARCECLLQPFANFVLVPVYERGVNVSVPYLEGMCNSVLDLCEAPTMLAISYSEGDIPALTARITLPSTQSQCRDFCSSV